MDKPRIIYQDDHWRIVERANYSRGRRLFDVEWATTDAMDVTSWHHQFCVHESDANSHMAQQLALFSKLVCRLADGLL